MGDEDASFGRIVNSVSSVYQLTHLEKGSPHRALSTGDGGAALSIVKELVHNNCTTETQQTQLDAANL